MPQLSLDVSSQSLWGKLITLGGLPYAIVTLKAMTMI